MHVFYVCLCACLECTVNSLKAVCTCVCVHANMNVAERHCKYLIPAPYVVYHSEGGTWCVCVCVCVCVPWPYVSCSTYFPLLVKNKMENKNVSCDLQGSRRRYEMEARSQASARRGGHQGRLVSGWSRSHC